MGDVDRADQGEVADTIRETLNSLGSHSRDVIALLPDAAVRVVLLDFETLPSNRQEAEGVVRFRLKKSLPFDVEKAKVSYHAQPANDAVRVVAAVALTTVIEEYESAFLQAGYSPGVVLPSMLAALGMIIIGVTWWLLIRSRPSAKRSTAPWSSSRIVRRGR